MNLTKYYNFLSEPLDFSKNPPPLFPHLIYSNHFMDIYIHGSLKINLVPSLENFFVLPWCLKYSEFLNPLQCHFSCMYIVYVCISKNRVLDFILYMKISIYPYIFISYLSLSLYIALINYSFNLFSSYRFLFFLASTFCFQKPFYLTC